jgi:hypothetical protein
MGTSTEADNTSQKRSVVHGAYGSSVGIIKMQAPSNAPPTPYSPATTANVLALRFATDPGSPPVNQRATTKAITSATNRNAKVHATLATDVGVGTR